MALQANVPLAEVQEGHNRAHAALVDHALHHRRQQTRLQEVRQGWLAQLQSGLQLVRGGSVLTPDCTHSLTLGCRVG